MGSRYEECRRLLSEEGVFLDETAQAKMEQFLGLVREWNEFASLVSARDLPRLEEEHVVDSLSLVSWVLREAGRNALILDIGTGGGFPAIPMKVAVPELRFLLVERSLRKVGFIRKALGRLELHDTTVVHGAFPECLGDIRPDVITARAVEKPERVRRWVLSFVPPGGIFLCQSRIAGKGLPLGFHVEHVDDPWTKAALRRGELFVVRRTPDQG